jgi:hypothetical protein
LAELDRVNPQIAARMANALAVLPRLVPALQAVMRSATEELRGSECSANLAEVLDRVLG